MPTHFRRFVPRLEALDDRTVPAVTVVPTGSLLTITGDTEANAIVISDTGQPGFVTETGEQVGGLTVAVDGGLPQWFGGITTISIFGDAGDDSVTYELTGPVTATRFVTAELGRGRDTFTATLNGQTVSGASTNFGITVQGDGGGDTMVLNAFGTVVNPEARLNVQFSGEAGKDAISFNHDPGFELLPNVTLTKDQKR